MNRLARITAAAAACLSLAAIPTATQAAGKVRPLGTEACTVSPNPVSNGQQYFVNGTGFRPGQVLNLRIDGTTLLTAADTTGSFSRWGWAQFITGGDRVVKVYQAGDRHMTTLTTCQFYASGQM